MRAIEGAQRWEHVGDVGQCAPTSNMIASRNSVDLQSLLLLAFSYYWHVHREAQQACEPCDLADDIQYST